MLTNPILHCPIRGTLKVKAKAKDGLTFTEEKGRIDCIKLLLAAAYPAERIQVETKVLKLGHKGKNSLRADVVVFDCPVTEVAGLSEEKQLEHTQIIAEIKRDSADSESAKQHQLIPALRFVPRNDVLGIYWDDVEQSLLFKEVSGGKIEIKEASISQLPSFGTLFKIKPIRYDDLQPAVDLVKVFSKFDDILHQAGHDLEERYDILLKILLVKIFDENKNRSTNGQMIIQDFGVMKVSDTDIIAMMDKALASSLVVYQNHLPKPISAKLKTKGDTIREISKLFCRVNLLRSSPQVIQEFYMYFMRHLYKVDLAQYFTPYEVIDFIVRLTNPTFGDAVKDPTCGSADFLVAAYRVARDRHKADRAESVFGADAGANAVQVSVLNMILNGDGKSNIRQEDSLTTIEKYDDQYTVILCNPHFGKDILEKRRSVLFKFDLGFPDGIRPSIHETKKPLDAQETGIMFVEVCVRSAKPSERIGIIVPNGYLGNRSDRYLTLRRWIHKHARVAAVVGFPRFTFKKSGADVSASVLIMEKRNSPLNEDGFFNDYPCHFNLIEKVGWDVRNKRAEKLYKRSELDGVFELDENNQPLLDADFSRVLSDLYRSPIIDAFSWIAEGVPEADVTDGWSVQFSEILKDPNLIIDPKRWCRKYRELVETTLAGPHFRLGDVLDFVSSAFKKKPSATYRYVEIENIYESFGAYEWEQFRGWNLAGRAKHAAKPGDVFIAHIWSSAGKWFIAGADAEGGDLIVTNRCYHLRVKDGTESLIPDLVFGLSTEMFRVQMRALATGSDGLSVVSQSDLMNIALPKLSNVALRTELSKRIEGWTKTDKPLRKLIFEGLCKDLPELNVAPRPSHVAQV